MEKHARVATSDAKSTTEFQLAGRALPLALEAAIYELLAPHELVRLFFASKSLRSQVIRFLNSCLRDIKMWGIKHIEDRIYLELAAEHCSNLQNIEVYAENDQERATQRRWIERMVQRNTTTLRSVRAVVSKAALALMERCHNLDRFECSMLNFANETLPAGEMSLRLLRLLQGHPLLTMFTLCQLPARLPGWMPMKLFQLTEKDMIAALSLRMRYVIL